MSRYVTDEAHDPRERFGLYRLCDCPTCEGKGKATYPMQLARWEVEYGERSTDRCPDCRGEGRIRQEVASCETAEAVGVALVTLAREGEWEECPFGLLDREPECETCFGGGEVRSDQYLDAEMIRCPLCKGSGVKPTGTWLLLPWLPSPRNVTDAARTLARQRVKNARDRLEELGKSPF